MIGNFIHEAFRYLTQNKIIGVPTDTVYGLAGIAYKSDVVEKIYKIKERPHNKPINVLIEETARISEVVQYFPLQARLLTSIFWPGPLTIVLPKSRLIPDIVTAGMPFVGVRVPSNNTLRDLLGYLPYPLAVPSANIFNHISPTTAQHVADQFGKQIPYILDDGPSQIGIESTIIGGFERDKEKPTVYRLGAISIEAIKKVIGHVEYTPAKDSLPQDPSSSKEDSLSHYKMLTPLVIGDIDKLFSRYKGKKVGILSFNKKIALVPEQRQVILSPKSKLKQAAHNLFSGLRYLDQLGCDIILTSFFPEKGLGKALNNLLHRASRHLSS